LDFRPRHPKLLAPSAALYHNLSLNLNRNRNLNPNRSGPSTNYLHPCGLLSRKGRAGEECRPRLLASHPATGQYPAEPERGSTVTISDQAIEYNSQKMKLTLILALTGVLATTLPAADSKDKVTSAAKQLADKANYSWTTSTKEADGSPGRLGPMQGKAEGGVTYLSFEVSGVPVEVYIKGEKGAAKGLEGWQTFDEVAQTSDTAAAVVRFIRNSKTPATESASLTDKAKGLTETDGAISGELKEDAVKELLLRGGRRREGQDPPKIEGAKGSVKFWTKDDVVTKYEINVQGKVTRGDRESDINRTTTVEIKDVGTTRLDIPAEARQKMT
jgi:hypothetical protein